MQSYIAILITIVIAALLVGAALILSAIIGPKSKTGKEKGRPFECGNIPFERPGKRFPVHFYVVAILFIVFDIEIVFLYPWIASFGAVGKYGFFAALFFVAVLTFGLVYEWIRGGLEWH
ncbi:MAG TPA: NADH-quinone oxidoreductase subunit A [archaeon]|nr:NADH-quinone oxidoreductase subunit A [archaeon]